MRNLIRRRFLPVMYDVAPPGKNAGDGWAYDQDAVETIGSIHAMRKHRSAGGTQERDGRVRAGSYPAALFLLPDGTKLGDGLWGILPPERFVKELHAVMAKWPEHFEASKEERAVLQAAAQEPDDPAAQLAAARLHWELAAFARVLQHTGEEVLAVASDDERGEMLYLRGRALLCVGRDDEARAAFERAAESASGDDLARLVVFQARLDMRAGEREKALARLLPLTDYERPGQWTGTAMYYAGLCHHRLKREEEAKKLWRRHRNELPFDRMARRSAGSLGLDESEAFLNQELLQRKGWW